MAVRSKRLWNPTVVGVTDVVLYTCPAGETALLKCLTLVNNAAVNTSLIVKLNSVSNSGAIVEATVNNGVSEYYPDLFVVLHPGDVLRAVAGLASVIVTGFGAELEGTAD